MRILYVVMNEYGAVTAFLDPQKAHDMASADDDMYVQNVNVVDMQELSSRDTMPA